MNKVLYQLQFNIDLPLKLGNFINKTNNLA